MRDISGKVFSAALKIHIKSSSCFVHGFSAYIMYTLLVIYSFHRQINGEPCQDGVFRACIIGHRLSIRASASLVL